MEQLSLFDNPNLSAPLASRLRPGTLEEFAGQKHLLGPGCILRQLIENDLVPSMIFSPPSMLWSATSSLAICLSVVTTCPLSSTDKA